MGSNTRQVSARRWRRACTLILAAPIVALFSYLLLPVVAILLVCVFNWR